MQIARRRRRPLAIDMSPLIDCVFQLLIFFMLSSTFLTPAMKLTLPTAAATEAATDQLLIVTLDADGEIYVNTEPATRDELLPKLRSLLAEAPDRVVTIRGDEQMAYDHFVFALDMARRAGARHINIAHQVER